MSQSHLYANLVRSHQVSMLKMRYRSAIIGWFGRHPHVYFPLARLFSNPVRDGKAVLVSSSTDLVVEGFPGSGNTFAVAALSISQGDALDLAHHVHVTAQIRRAIRLRRPIVVVRRSPEEAIASFLGRASSLRPQLELILREYIAYHEFLLERRRHILIVEFEEVISDFGKVMRQIDDRFALGLRPFVHDQETERECFRWIAAWYRKGGWIEQRERKGRAVPDAAAHSPKPSEARTIRKQHLRAAMQAPRAQRLLMHAQELYVALGEPSCEAGAATGHKLV